MLCDTIIVFDHLYQTVKVVSHVYLPSSSSAAAGSPLPASNVASTPLPLVYATAVSKARRAAKLVLSTTLPTVPQPPITLGVAPVSNVGKEGYEGFVTKLKEHIVKGDIIQAVPSQRLSKPTALHPFNAYRKLRQTNPSPYMFFVDCGDLQLVGASPETLCKVEKSKVYNHAIAGTIKRGATVEGRLDSLIHFPTPTPIDLSCLPFRGCGTRKAAARIRKGSSGAHYAGRPCPERCQPGMPTRDRPSGPSHAIGEVQPRHALDEPDLRQIARRQKPVSR